MKRLHWTLGCVLALAGLGATACDGGDEETDAGPPDAGPPTPMVMAFDGTAQVPADLSCIGTRMAPAGSGAAAAVAAVVNDFQTGDAVEGLNVQFFPDNMVSADGSCTGSCQMLTTNATGQVTAMDVIGSWYAYRIQAGSGVSTGAPKPYLRVVQYNETAAATGNELNAISMTTQNSILALLGRSGLAAGTAVVTGSSSDCMGRPLVNATVRLFDSSGEISLGFASTGARAFYFNGNTMSPFPSAAQRRTNNDGLYGGADVPPPADNQVRVEIWGVRTEGAAPSLIGCERVQALPDSVTIINVGPRRMDGPAGCSGT